LNGAELKKLLGKGQGLEWYFLIYFQQVLLLHAQLTNSAMKFRLIAFFRSPVMVSPTVPAHQLEGIIPGVQPQWMTMMQMVFGDSVEKNVL
jgi:hypothetical protein